MLDKSKIKLFRMDDYMWVAAESAEQANEWYIKEFGEENDLDKVVEEPLTKGFWQPVADLTEKEQSMSLEQKTISNELFAKVPFNVTLGQLGDIETPFVAGSTEW